LIAFGIVVLVGTTGNVITANAVHTWAFQIAVTVLLVATTLRAGFLCLAVGMAAFTLIERSLLTLDAEAWYLPTSALTAAWLLGLAGLAFHHATRRAAVIAGGPVGGPVGGSGSSTGSGAGGGATGTPASGVASSAIATQMMAGVPRE
jgi:hypothetical protein